MNAGREVEHPFRQFESAFALMTIIPMLGFVFILTDALSLAGLEGNRGMVVGLLIFISLLGYFFCYRIIRSLLEKVLRYTQTLKRLDEMKSIFVSEVSHEAKNPLVTTRLGLSFLTEELTGILSDEQRDLVTRCQRSIDRVIRLTTDLLDLAKIESGTMSVNVEAVDLKPLVDEICQFMKVHVDQKKLAFRTEFRGHDFTMQCDRDHMARVVLNLLDNAVKYTESGRCLGVDVAAHSKAIDVDVWNESDPIPEDRKEKIFDRFERISQDKTTGHGLGLSIVKELVVLHGGEIRVESKDARNHFTVHLPRDFRNQ